MGDLGRSDSRNAPTSRALEARVEWLAGRQGGNVTRGQLLALGLTDAAIRHRIRSGRLFRVHAGVYAVGRRPATPLERAHAAVLASGPEAALSHGSAGAHLHIVRDWAEPVHVTTRHDRRPSGVIVHRSACLLPVDRPIIDGIRTTSRARTVLDLTPADRFSDDRQLLRAINDQRFDHGMRLWALQDVVARFPRHPGATRLRRVLGEIPPEPFRSGWECTFPEYADEHHLPEYDMNVPLARGVIADVVFRPRLIVLELDGWEAHRLPDSFRRDRARDRRVYAELGIPSFRIVHADVREDPAGIATQIKQIIARRRTELGLV